MTPLAPPRRRALLRALAALTLASAVPPSLGQERGEGGPGRSEKAKDEKKGGKGAKAGKGVALTVVVTGNGKPVAQAEVKVKFPVGGETTLPTNNAGEALFNSSGTGAATVRVIATGWESVLQDVVLKEGPQQLTVKLNPLANAK